MTDSSRRRFYLTTVGPLVGLLAGFGLGFAAHDDPGPVLGVLLPIAESLGTLWINALRMIVVPFMLVLLMLAVASLRHGSEFGKLGITALAVHVGLMALGAGLAISLFQILAPGINTSGVDLPSSDAPIAAAGAHGVSFAEWFAALVPTNLFRAAADEAIISLIVVAVLFGFAIRTITAEGRDLLVKGLRALHQMFEVVLHWIIALMTAGVFCVTLTAGARIGPDVVVDLAGFVVVVSLVLVLFTGAMYLIMIFAGGSPPGQVVRALWPVQILAASSRSSLACLPLLADAARNQLGVPDRVAGFILPLSNSTFRLNRALSNPIDLMFLAYLYGIPLDATTIGLFVLAVMLTNFGTPGLPSAGMFTSAPLYLAAGIPLEGVVLLKAIDAIPDVFKTICNVTGDMTVLLVANRWGRQGSGTRLPQAP